MTPFNLNNKVALVTGGGSGIGAAICRRFAHAGAEVYVLDFQLGAAEIVASQIRETGGIAVAIQGDVADQASMVAKVQALVTASGKIDILVNNAGIAHVGNVESTTEKDFDRIYAVNVKGVYNSLFAVVPHMKMQGQGVIVNLGSIASSVGLPDRFAYSMSKGAVEAMTYATARDYVQHGIRCNSIAPARVHTPFVDGFIGKNYPGREAEMFALLSKTQPLGRMGSPEEVANLALFLCSDEASFITGTNYPLDGGFIRLNT